ncbi:MAG: hypothetical protein HQK77_01055 [Desulfobacterales bacterium]|nr:hypothetical protein [Desulfobacterales bacterium]
MNAWQKNFNQHELAIELFDLTSLHPLCKGFSGVVFDGRYIYLSPCNNGTTVAQVLRFDPTLPFDQPDSWNIFEITKINPDSRGFVDLLFDGQYIYFIPFYQQLGKHHGTVTRYDTRLTFDDSKSWSFFDTTTLHPNCRGFVSGCFDGSYIYLSPYQVDWNTTNSQVTRYNTGLSFSDKTAWQVFDTQQLYSDCRGFHGAIVHGNYVYFVPYLRLGKEYNGRLTLYNREKEFHDHQAWQSIDLTNFNSRARGFISGTSLGKYIYLAPYFDGNDRYGQVARYNTELDIADSASWEFFDSAIIDPGSRGFFGALNDGRYVYFMPHCRGIEKYHGQMTIYDSNFAFTDPNSWTILDTAIVNPACRGFIGGVLHNGYLYMAPFEIDAGQHSGLMIRVKLEFLRKSEEKRMKKENYDKITSRSL